MYPPPPRPEGPHPNPPPPCVSVAGTISATEFTHNPYPIGKDVHVLYFGTIPNHQVTQVTHSIHYFHVVKIS